MDLSNEFVVPVEVEEAWAILSDLQRIAPCLPGAQLREVDGDEYRGVVKVKVGPITANYDGKASFLEKDEHSHKMVIKAQGRDTRGQGNAQATITAVLSPVNDGTHVSVVTELAITGRAAQFGRGVLADVSTKLLGQFVNCLEQNVLRGDQQPSESVDPEHAGGQRHMAAPASTEPIDLLSTAAGTTLVRRLLSASALMIGFILLRRRRRAVAARSSRRS